MSRPADVDHRRRRRDPRTPRAIVRRAARTAVLRDWRFGAVKEHCEICPKAAGELCSDPCSTARELFEKADGADVRVT